MRLVCALGATYVVAATLVIWLVARISQTDYAPIDHAAVAPYSSFVMLYGPLVSPNLPFFRRDPYSLPWPRPLELNRADETLHSILNSLVLVQSSPFVNLLWPPLAVEPMPGPCQMRTNGTAVRYSSDELANFKLRIEENYCSTLYLDGIPALSVVGSTAQLCVPIGWLDGELYLYNHVDLHIGLDHYGRVIRLRVEPSSVSEPCADPSPVPVRAHEPISWSYRLWLSRLSDVRYENWWHYYDDALGQSRTRTGASYVLLSVTMLLALIWIGCLGLFTRAVIRHDLSSTNVFLQATDGILKTFASQPDKQPDNSRDVSDESCAIEMTTNMERQVLVPAQPGSDSPIAYIKNHIADIVATPANPVLFSALVAWGAYAAIAGLTLITALALLIASSNPYASLPLVVYMVVVIVCSFVLGLVGRYMAGQVGTRSYLRLLAALWLLPLLLLSIQSLFGSIELEHRSGKTVAALVFVTGALVLTSLVGIVAGMLLAKSSALPAWLASVSQLAVLTRRRTEYSARERTLRCLRSVAYLAGTSAVVCTLIGGGGTFAVFSLTASLWDTSGNHIWMGMMLLVLICWMLTIAVAAPRITYIIIVKGRLPRWWWHTLSVMSSTAIIPWLVLLLWIGSSPDLVGWDSRILAALLATVACGLFGLISGAIGVLSSWVYLVHVILRSMHVQSVD